MIVDVSDSVELCIVEITRVACIYRCVSILIYMDIQIGWQVYRSAGNMYIHWPVYDADLSTSSLLNFHSGQFTYKHVIGHAGLLSSRASVKAIYGVCIL